MHFDTMGLIRTGVGVTAVSFINFFVSDIADDVLILCTTSSYVIGITAAYAVVIPVKYERANH